MVSVSLLSGLWTHLICLSGLKVLELALETQVGASTGTDHLHSRKCVLPAQSRHCHDVSDHEGDAAGNSRQTEGRDGYREGSMKFKLLHFNNHFSFEWLNTYYQGRSQLDQSFCALLCCTTCNHILVSETRLVVLTNLDILFQEVAHCDM